MKMFLMAVLAVFMMSGTSVAAEANVIIENATASVQQQQNVVDKMISMINSFTKKINATKTIDELMKVGDQCYTDMMEFQEKYEKEMMAIENTLTEKQKQEYEKKIEKALTEFEAAINKKSNQLMEEYDIDY